MIKYWNLLEIVKYIQTFIGIIDFYMKCDPYFEIILETLRKICKRHFRQLITKMYWTPQLITLFEPLKERVILSPVLYQFDSNTKIFLKTDWSAKGMIWILMQPADDKESLQSEKSIINIGGFKFDFATDK